MPLALLEVELTELGDVLGADAQTVSAGRDALRAGLPCRVLDAQRFEESRPEVIEYGLPGHLLDDRREHVGRRRVVQEMRAWLERHGMRKEGLGPRLVVGVRVGSVCWPVDMRSRSLTRIALRLSLGSAGASSGKNFSTSSSTLSFPRRSPGPRPSR